MRNLFFYSILSLLLLMGCNNESSVEGPSVSDSPSNSQSEDVVADDLADEEKVGIYFEVIDTDLEDYKVTNKKYFSYHLEQGESSNLSLTAPMTSNEADPKDYEILAFWNRDEYVMGREVRGEGDINSLFELFYVFKDQVYALGDWTFDNTRPEFIPIKGALLVNSSYAKKGQENSFTTEYKAALYSFDDIHGVGLERSKEGTIRLEGMEY